jgi:hypothetical protein
VEINIHILIHKKELSLNKHFTQQAVWELMQEGYTPRLSSGTFISSIPFENYSKAVPGL